MHLVIFAALMVSHHAPCDQACQMRANFRQSGADFAKAGWQGALIVVLIIAAIVAGIRSYGPKSRTHQQGDSR